MDSIVCHLVDASITTAGAASDPSAPVPTVIDGYLMGLAKRSFQVS
jgi:hypothetical protein